MFDGTVADALQLVSLPLELTGFGLALIEIRFRGFADHLRTRILALTAKSRTPFFEALRAQRARQSARQRVMEAIGLAIPIVGGSAVVAALLLRGETAPAGLLATFLIVALLSPYVLGPLLRALIRTALRFVSSFAQGREIGVLGLLIAGLGITAEFYQVGELVQTGFGFEDTTAPALLLVLGWTLILTVALGVLGSLLLYQFPGLREFVQRHWPDEDP